MRDILVIFIVILCSLVALRQPVVGILSFICLSLLNLHGMSWGIARTFPFAQLTAIGTLIGYISWSGEKKLPRHRESYFLIILWCLFVGTTVFAIEPEIAQKQLIHISKILLMVFLSMFLLNSFNKLNMLMRVITLALGFHGLKSGIFAIMTGGSQLVYGPENSFLTANNSIGLALAMNIPLLYYMQQVEPNRWLRRIMITMLVFSYPAVVCTFSRGAWLGLAAGTFLIIWKSHHRTKLLIVMSLMWILLLPFVLDILPNRVLSRYNDLVNYEHDGSAQSRFWNWELCRRVGVANPLHGGGFDFYSKEIYSLYYPEFNAHWGSKVWSCHSAWFTILGEHGVITFSIWLGLFVSYFFSIRKMLRLGKSHVHLAWVIPYAEMLQITMVVYMVVSTFLDTAYFDIFYQLVAALVILKECFRRSLSNHTRLSNKFREKTALARI